MKKAIFILVVIALAVFMANESFALTVTAKSVSSGVYEDGKFTPKSDGFKARYLIDEAEGTVMLERIFENDREGRFEEGAMYEITNIVVSEGISALTVSRNKKGQKIITAVREGLLGVFEVLIIGEDFYEYTSCAGGKFYLEYGEVY